MIGAVFMSDERRNIIRVAGIYAASITGAGFASGQEILRFFSVYRTGGFYGILLAGALFSVLGSIVLNKVYSERIRSYEELIFPVFGWRIGWIIETAATLFIFCMHSIMTAGAGNILAQLTGIPFRIAVFVMGAVSAFLIMTDIKGIAVLSSVLTPVLIAGIIITGLCIIIMKNSPAFSVSGYISQITDNWLFSSLLYVSYNSILAIMVLCSVQPYLKTRRTAVAAGILGGTALTMAALVINAVIFLFYPSAADSEIPLIDILQRISASAGKFYSVLLWLAMLVSAVTSGFCFTDRIYSLFRLDKCITALMLCIFAAPLSMLGFSRLISLIYPAFGWLGLFMVIVILMTGLRRPIPGSERNWRGRAGESPAADVKQR